MQFDTVNVAPVEFAIDLFAPGEVNFVVNRFIIERFCFSEGLPFCPIPDEAQIELERSA